MSDKAFPPGGDVFDILEKMLTPVSIGAVMLGLVLVIVGPVTSLINRQVDGLRTADGSLFGVDIPGSERETTLTTDQLLMRQLLPFTTIPDRPLSEVANYIVKPGDTLLAIAENFGLDPSTVVWSNNHKLQGDVHMIQPDMELFILPVDGAYIRSYEELTIAQIADRYNVEPEAIINSPFNNLEGASPIDTPNWGTWVVIPGGVGAAADLYKPVITETTDSSGNRVVGFMQGMGGSCAAGLAGSGGTGSFGIPMGGAFSFSQGFYAGHSGVDLAAPTGTPVLAADTGIVIFSGWVNTDWGYGVLVVLDHGNGFTSYYAHLSATSVGCGQLVSKGGQVGAVGSTGNSSGAHLHFEIRSNHVPLDPTGYIGY